MPLTFTQLEEISGLLRQVAPLVDRLEGRRSDFGDGVQSWLKQAETTLENCRLPAVSQVAACRSMLVQAGRGMENKEVSFAGRPTPRKIRDATASLVLDRCNRLLHDLIADRHAAFQEADRLARQLIAVAEVNGIMQNCKSASTHQAFLQCVQKSIAADPNLAGVYTHLVSLVGKTDVLIVLDRAIVD